MGSCAQGRDHRVRRGSLAAALVAAACAFVPAANPRLEEAKDAYRAAATDPDVVRLAPTELGEARAALDRAVRASNTLQDPAEVDHLAYLAKQRAAISRELALQRSLASEPR